MIISRYTIAIFPSTRRDHAAIQYYQSYSWQLARCPQLLWPVFSFSKARYPQSLKCNDRRTKCEVFIVLYLFTLSHTHTPYKINFTNVVFMMCRRNFLK